MRRALADYLLQFARHLIYSTAMPPAQAVALSATLAVIRSDDGQRRRKTGQPRGAISRRHGWFSGELSASTSAIQPLIVGDNTRALQLAARLREQGLLGNGHSSADGAGRQRAAAPDADRSP